MKQKSFTLIELLIVVAIIGILAAIAVPNFMNAQVKAKVARVQSDFMAIITAEEMYRLDYNIFTSCARDGTILSRSERYAGLIAGNYISSVPLDPFPDASKPVSQGGGGSGILVPDPPYIWMEGYSYSGENGWGKGQWVIYHRYFGEGDFKGWVSTRGPSGKTGTEENSKILLGILEVDQGRATYDSSNGLRSLGFIHRFIK